jgi:hypothetical protein
MVRNPFLRLLSGAAYQNAIDMKEPKEKVIQDFRTFVILHSKYILSTTYFLKMKNGVVRPPDYIILNENVPRYVNEVINLLRILGYVHNSTQESRLREVRSSFDGSTDKRKQLGHHLLDTADTVTRQYSDIPVSEYDDDATINFVLKRYKDDFTMFYLERNVSKLSYRT